MSKAKKCEPWQKFLKQMVGRIELISERDEYRTMYHATFIDVSGVEHLPGGGVVSVFASGETITEALQALGTKLAETYFDPPGEEQQ